MSAVPNLLKIGAIPSNLAMSVETGILDPVVQNDSFIRFNMKRSGFLHSNSKLVLSMNKKATADWQKDNKHSMLPASVGIGSVVERVRLLSGNTVIQEIQDWGELHAYRSMFISNENNKEREQYTTGRLNNMNYEWTDSDALDTYNGTVTPATSGVALRSDTSAPDMTIDTATDFYSHTHVADGAGVAQPDDTAGWTKRLQRFQYLENEPVWQVSLQDLCPFLKQTQLPLFMFKEEIYLEITFATPTKRAIVNQTYATALGPALGAEVTAGAFVVGTTYQIKVPGTTNFTLVGATSNAVGVQFVAIDLGEPTGAVGVGDGTVDTVNTQVTPNYTVNPVESKLIIDYITYPNETMEAWAQANQNLSFQYYDYELGKFTVTRDVKTKDSVFIRDCGGAGKVINKIIMGLQRDSSNMEPSVTQINGGFSARHPPTDATKIRDGRVVSNLRYNTEYLYPIDVKNDAYHFNNVLQAEGQPPMVTRAMYSGQGGGTSGRKFEGLVQNTCLENDYFWQTFKLNHNNRINQKGIELYQSYMDMATGNHTLRIWLEVVKIAQLVDGKLETNYA